jgi:hypothetical protein
MENHSWLITSKTERDAALYALKQAKYKVGRRDVFTGEHELSVMANDGDWEDVERILRQHAPGAVRNLPE